MHRRLYHHLKRGVYECNSKCPCNAACENRVSQGGLICRLQFFPCGQKGWGVRTLHFIPKGMFIGLYNGRVIQSWQINPQDLRQSQYICELMDANEGHGVDGAGDDDEEALEKKRQKAKRAKKKQRRRARAAAKRKNNATAPVASTSAAAAAADAAAADSDSSGSSGSEESPPPPPAADGPGLSREQLFRKNTSKEFLVDGSVDGNVTRSFNHSCAPNIFSQQIFTETHDIRFPEMALFAARFVLTCVILVPFISPFFFAETFTHWRSSAGTTATAWARTRIASSTATAAPSTAPCDSSKHSHTHIIIIITFRLI